MTPAFAEYVAARLSALRAYAHVLCGDADQARALVEEALIRAGLAWSRASRDENPEAFVRGTIVALYVGGWRRQRSRSEAATQRKARAVHVLKRVDGLPDEEIARVVGWSEQTVRQFADPQPETG